MPLQIATGYVSLTGQRADNEDYCGVATPDGLELENKGAMAAIADGVGTAKGGKAAAEYTVRGLLNDYFATPETWSIPHAIEKVTGALNRWVIAEGNRRPELAGMATTLSVLVLRGRRYYTAHIGDTRIYRLRAGELQQLTVDHLWDHAEHRNVLSRAIGLDPRATLDFTDGELAPGDRFLLVSGGVWRVLSDDRLRAALLAQPDAQAAAAALTSQALSSGGQANASAVVIDVTALAPENLRDSLAGAASLPIPPRLSPGQEIDGLRVEEVLRETGEILEYRVRHLRNDQQLVLKTLVSALSGEQSAIQALLLEEWRRRCVIGPNFAPVVPAEARTHLYYLTLWQPGASLRERLDGGQQFSIGEVVRFGMRLLKAVSCLHRLDLVHADLAPENVHLGQDGVLRLQGLEHVLPFGERPAAGLVRQTAPADQPPESFRQAAATAEWDLYSVGVILYGLLTGGRHPYGDNDGVSAPDFNQPCVRPTRWRKDVPLWLESILLKALEVDPRDRFETAEEFVLALERGPSRPVPSYDKQALIRRNPLLFWKSVAGCSLLLNLMLFMAYNR